MQLHQLLRHVKFDTPIIIFDLQGIEIARVANKDDINVDLYEYEIFDLGIGLSFMKSRIAALYITIVK